jgi:hypothetical protein
MPFSLGSGCRKQYGIWSKGAVKAQIDQIMMSRGAFFEVIITP